LSGVNNIRPSSFQYSHGPGSVLETSSGPVIVKSPGSLFDDFEGLSRMVRGEEQRITISNFEIIEPRLSRELGGSRLVRLPSNEEFGRPAIDQIYPTIPEFPRWCVCPVHRRLYKAWRDGGFRECARCRRERADPATGADVPSTQDIARDQPIRFVLACSNGHLNDVDWTSVVHRGEPCPGQNDSQFYWNHAGGSISDIWINCPACPAGRNLGEIYTQDHECLGTHLHESGFRDECLESARVVQRGSAGLYLPEHESALDICAISNRTMKAIDEPSISERLRMLTEMDLLDDRERLRDSIEACERSPNTLRNDLIDRINDDAQWPNLLNTIRERISGEADTRGIRELEFEVLVQSSREGSPPPPINNRQDATRSLLLVKQNECYSIPTEMGATISVAPVQSLRVVTALTGFTRQVGDSPPETVPLSFDFNEAEWCMAMDTISEGVFLHFQEGSVPVSADHPRAEYWLRKYEEENETNLHPQHVWWHTLSHLLIKHISLDSGFSSASIRERTYAIEGPDGAIECGVLLYPSQQGGDGTLGGLCSLVKNRDAFSSIMQKCRSEVLVCSNDPLCEESVETSDGAACFACCLASETSCEHRNFGLDRLLLKESLP